MSGHSTSRRSYDSVVARYEQAIGDQLAVKPLDRALLAAAADQCAGGVVGDLGCGPGHVAAHLTALGAHVVGVDLSPAMCALAGRRGVPAVARELARVLRPAGWALIAFHTADADARPGDNRRRTPEHPQLPPPGAVDHLPLV